MVFEIWSICAAGRNQDCYGGRGVERRVSVCSVVTYVLWFVAGGAYFLAAGSSMAVPIVDVIGEVLTMSRVVHNLHNSGISICK